MEESKPIDYFIDLIARRSPFTFNRFGDGEWASILGQRGRNCDGAEYTPELRASLTNVLKTGAEAQKNSQYYFGMLAIARKIFKDTIDVYLDVENIDIQWVDGTVFVQANRNGNLGKFIEVVRLVDMIYVGPKHLRKLDRIFHIKDFLQVHSKRAFDTWESTVKEVLRISDSCNFIGVSAGPGAKIMVHALNHHLGKTHTIFDFGSLWDGYVGVGSRRYMRRPTWRDALERNLIGFR